MKVSARNQIPGIVESVETGAVSTIVHIDIGGDTIKACVSSNTADSLDICKDRCVYAMVTAHDVSAFSGNLASRISNALHGWVAGVSSGAVCSIVQVELESGICILCDMTNEDVESQSLRVGAEATVHINPNDVSLGIG